MNEELKIAFHNLDLDTKRKQINAELLIIEDLIKNQEISLGIQPILNVKKYNSVNNFKLTENEILTFFYEDIFNIQQELITLLSAYNNENEYKMINLRCDKCEFYNENQNKCIFYKDGISKDIKGNNINCKHRKIDSIIDNLDEKYKYYSKLYFEFFGKKAFIANPGGSKEQTIDAIKKSLIEGKDLLGGIMNPIEENIYY